MCIFTFLPKHPSNNIFICRYHSYSLNLTPKPHPAGYLFAVSKKANTKQINEFIVIGQTKSCLSQFLNSLEAKYAIHNHNYKTIAG